MQCSEESVNELKKYYKDGVTYTTYNWGGYIIWNFPEIKASTDGRMHLWRDEEGYSGFAHDYRIEQNLDDVDESKYEVVLTFKEKPIYKRLLELVEFGSWKKVYEDKTAAIFVRVNEST